MPGRALLHGAVCYLIPAVWYPQGLPVVSLTVDGTNVSATIIADLSTCDNRTAGTPARLSACAPRDLPVLLPWPPLPWRKY